MQRYSTEILPYSIQPGDNLWFLAGRHQTTIEAIMTVNPGIDPYRLYAGQIIGIPRAGQRASGSGMAAEIELMNTMRMLWEQHVAWTRMLILSIAAHSPDESLVTKRLLRNPADMAAVFNRFYGGETAAKFNRLMTDHLVIAAQLVKAAQTGNQAAAADAEKRWYANADEIAAFLHKINPYWSMEIMKDMMHEHLRLTKSEAVSRLGKKYAADIEIYDQIERQALEMADAFTKGIVQQFPDAFRG